MRAMVDSGATNNFVSQHEVDKLGLTVAKSLSKLKAVNSETRSIQGSAMANLVIGSWEGEVNMIVFPLDDFDLILGVEFFVKAKVSVVPYLCGIFIGDEDNSCFVQAIGWSSGKGKAIELQSVSSSRLK